MRLIITQSKQQSCAWCSIASECWGGDCLQLPETKHRHTWLVENSLQIYFPHQPEGRTCPLSFQLHSFLYVESAEIWLGQNIPLSADFTNLWSIHFNNTISPLWKMVGCKCSLLCGMDRTETRRQSIYQPAHYQQRSHWWPLSFLMRYFFPHFSLGSKGYWVKVQACFLHCLIHFLHASVTLH